MIAQSPIAVSIVEDDIEFLEGIRFFLNESSSIEVAGSYSNGKDAIEGMLTETPAVALIDIGLPDISGINVIKELKKHDLPTEFLVLSVYDDDKHIFQAIKAGAVGYILKSDVAIFSEAAEAIENVVKGGAPMSFGIARRVIDEFREKKKDDRRIEMLTRRENEVLDYLSKGYATRQVAKTLFISYETVRCHQKNIYTKLQVNSSLEAVAVLRGER